MAAEAAVGPRRRGPARWQWWVGFVTLFAASAAWLLTTPPMGAADEPSHVIYAAAAVRGQLQAPTVVVDRSGTTAAVAHLPGWLGQLSPDRPCYATRYEATVDCGPALLKPGTPQVSYAGRYPPVYYLLVGLPSLLDTGPSAVYLMRLVSALLCAALIASALLTAAEWAARVLVPALAVAATPMAVFMFGAVNPSGLEIAAALAVWMHGLRLVLDPAAPRRRVVVRFGVAMAALAVARPISPLWLLMILVVLALLAPLPRLLALLRRPDVLVAGGVAVLAALSTVLWVRTAGSLNLLMRPASAAMREHVWNTELHRVPRMITWMVGWLGWADVSTPTAVLYGWLLLIGLFVGLGWLLGSWRARLALAATLAGTLVVPMVLEAAQLDKFGPYWQGRYTLPFAVGLVLVAAAAVAAGEPIERLRSMPAQVGGAIAGLHVLMAFAALRRWSVGTAQTYVPGAGTRWWPPGGRIVVLVWVVAAVALAGGVTLLGRGRPAVPGPPADPDPPEPAPASAQDEETAAVPAG
jgi:Predicted membrane protein (DUF2142)